MPLYEYHCESCGHRFEVIVKFSDPPLEACPKCGGAVRKLLSSPAIQFKGSGWYITDYARKSGETTESREGGGDGKAAKDGTDTKESKQSQETKETKTGKPDAGAGKPAAAPSGSKAAGSTSAASSPKAD